MCFKNAKWIRKFTHVPKTIYMSIVYNFIYVNLYSFINFITNHFLYIFIYEVLSHHNKVYIFISFNISVIHELKEI